MTWADMLEQGMAGQVGYGDVNVSVMYVRDRALGELLMGVPFLVALDALGENVHDRHLMVVGIDGSRSLGPLPRLFLAQAGDTLPLTSQDFMDLGAITAGKLDGVFQRPGLWLVKRSLDLSAPFQVGLRRCCGDPPVSVEYVVEEPAPPAASSRQPGRVETAAPTPPSADAAEPASPMPPATPASAGSASPGTLVELEPASASSSPPAAPEASGPTPLIRLAAVFGLTTVVLVGAALLGGRRRARSPRGDRES
jgi:hypothetical protein